MKNKNWGKTILALLLAMMMILPSVAAMAEEAESEDVYEGTPLYVDDGTVYSYDFETDEWAEDKDLTESKKLDGDLAVIVEKEGTYHGPAALAVYSNGAEDKESFEVTGSVSMDVVTNVDEESFYDYADATGKAVYIEAYDDASADLTVGGDIAVSVESTGDFTYSHSSGLDVDAGDGATITVTAGGDVSASTVVIDESEEGQHAEIATAAAVDVSDWGQGKTTDISIDGGVTAEAVVPEGEAQAGAVLVNYDEGGDGLAGENDDGQEGEGETSSSIIITVKKDATATATVGDKDDDEDEYSYATAGAIAVNAYTGQTVDVLVEGHASAEATNNGEGRANAAGITATTYSESSEVAITVLDGVEATATAADEESEAAYAIMTRNNDGHITVNVTGDAESSEIGILMYDMDGTEPDKDKPYEGEITPSEDDKYDDRNGMYYQIIDGEKVFYTIDDDGKVVKKLCSKDDRKGGESFVTVEGNVTADDTAIAVVLTEEQSTMEVTVTETVEGKEHAIVLTEETIADNLTLTVWEVKPNEDGNIVERFKMVENEDAKEGEDRWTEQYTADEDTEKLIQYIIRIEDNSKNYIATSGTKDFTASNGETYQVANQGDKVLVKLNVPKDKELVGAYWDVAKSEAGKLLKDSEGNYYVEVPRGGGVQLSLVMKDIPKPASNVSYCTLKFFEDKDATAKSVSVAKGRTYTLPAAPVKEGKTFVGWAMSDVDPSDPNYKEPAEGDASILAAGSEYKVTETKSFVGIWK